MATYEPMQVGVFAAQARAGLITARNAYTLAWRQLASGMGLPGTGDVFRPFTNVVNRAGVPFGPDYELIARQAMAAGMVLSPTNTSNVAYQASVAPIRSRAMRWPLTRLSVIEPVSEPTAKLADR